MIQYTGVYWKHCFLKWCGMLGGVWIIYIYIYWIYFFLGILLEGWDMVLGKVLY